jgi:hypothetical protein
MLSVVIALLTVAAMAGSVLTLRQMRRNREVNALLARLAPLRCATGLTSRVGMRAPDRVGSASDLRRICVVSASYLPPIWLLLAFYLARIWRLSPLHFAYAIKKLNDI